VYNRVYLPVYASLLYYGRYTLVYASLLYYGGYTSLLCLLSPVSLLG